MKILYDNLLISATLSATDVNASYPVDNLTDRFLEKRFQSTIASTTVTASWATDQTISAVAVGYTNATSGTYTLKDSGGSTLITGSLDLNYDTDMTYFTEQTAVRSMEILFTSTAPVYVGGVSAGKPFTVDYHNVNPRVDFINNDSSSILRGGQSTGVGSRSRLRFRATVSDLSLAQRLEWQEAIDTVGNWMPVYADLYDLNHAEIRPIYSLNRGNGQFNRDSRAQDYSSTFVFEEVR